MTTGGGFKYFKLGSKLLFQSMTESGSEWWVTGGTGGVTGQGGAVPEPSTLLLVGIGMLFAGKRYRTRK